MGKTKILYIEDDESERKRYSRLLRSKGFAVDSAPSGESGLKKFVENQAEVILCDLNMPGMNGLEVLTEAQRINPEIPFIITTAHGSIPLAVKAIKQGAYDFILKPLEIDEIVTTVQKAIEKTKLQKALRKSESSLQMLMENVPDIVYSLNPRGEFLSVSPAGEAILGYKPSDMVGTSVFDYIYSEDFERVKAGFEHAVKTGNTSVKTIEFRMVAKSGEVKDFEVNRRLIVEKGQVIRQDGIARDVSRRKQLEDELKKYSQGLEKLVQERTESLEYATRQLAALNAASNRFTLIHDEDELLDEVPELLTHSLDFDRAFLLLEKDGELALRSYCMEKDPPDLVESFLKRIRTHKFVMPPQLIESFEQNKTIFIPDLNADRRWPREPGQIVRTKAVVVCPIKVNKKPIGVILGNMQHHEREMDAQDVARFEMFANMVGLALDNIRSYQSLERKVIERTRSLRDANRELREKAKELEKTTYSLGNANVQLLSVQEQLQEKNAQMQKLLTEKKKVLAELEKANQ
ncbi:MAG: response regulator, partial [bacterium]